jgi:hypothetical protein
VTAALSVPLYTATQGRAVAPYTPITGSGGTGALTFTVSPALPAGLSMDPATGIISGTATVAASSSTYAVTVKDTLGASASKSFSLAVDASITATTAVAATTLDQSQAATSFAPVKATGGDAPLSYSVSPALPAGLALGKSNGSITGTPTATVTAAIYTVTVTDANGATGTATFTLTVNSAVTATIISSTNTVMENNPSSFTPVAGSGGTAPLAYSVSPALPAGLSISSITGTVSGTPTVMLSVTTFTVTVTDAKGAKATKTFTLTVDSAVTATAVIPSTTLTEGVTAASFTPVTGAYGVGTRTFSVSPTLPAGLSFSASTGAITGKPTVTHSASNFTVTVTDSSAATASAAFSLTVVP